MIRRGFCSVCTTQKEEERDLVIDGDMIYCTNCGAAHIWKQHGNTERYYLERLYYEYRDPIKL